MRLTNTGASSARDKYRALTLNTAHPRELWRPYSPPGTQHHIPTASSDVIMTAVFCKMEVLPQLGCSKYERDDISLCPTSPATPRLVLHKKDASPPSNAVRMVAAILGLQLDYKEPDLLKLEHKTPEFKKINPMGTIPVLEDGSYILSESHAIILYLVDKYGGEHKAALYPFDPQTRGLVNQCLFFDAFVMFRRLQDVAKPTLLNKKPGPTEEDLTLIDDAYAALEAYLQSRQYVACDHVTVADVSLGSTVTALQWIHVIDAERFPKSRDWLDRMEAEPYFKEVNEPGATAFGHVMKHFWELNKKSD